MKHLPYGTRVEIRGIEDGDADLNRLRGKLVRKHAFSNRDRRLTFGDIGIVVETEGSWPIRANLLHGEYKEI